MSLTITFNEQRHIPNHHDLTYEFCDIANLKRIVAQALVFTCLDQRKNKALKFSCLTQKD